MKSTPLTRRSFIHATTLALASLGVGAASRPSTISTRGVVLYPFDLTLSDWPRLAQEAGLTTIALHAAVRTDVLVNHVRSDAGQRFLRECRRRKLHVEYELHAMGDLLSREYACKDTTLFRQNKEGARVTDFNCCPSSQAALDLIGQKALEIAKVLKPTSHRYFYWPDDGREWCSCDRCRGFPRSHPEALRGNLSAADAQDARGLLLAVDAGELVVRRTWLPRMGNDEQIEHRPRPSPRRVSRPIGRSAFQVRHVRLATGHSG